MASCAERGPVSGIIGVWPKAQPRSRVSATVVRRFLKRGLEQALTTDTVERWTRRRVRGKTLILAYHGIVPRNEARAGEHSLFVSETTFAAHLDLLAEVADVAALDRIDEPGDERPRVAITFDDAYQGAVTTGVNELARRGLPATIFVSPGRLNGHVFWWDALARPAGHMDPPVRTHALTALGGDDERVRAWAAQAAVPTSDALPPYARAASLDEMRSALEHPGLTLGSHSWSHANLARLDAAALDAELSRPLAWLREHFATRTVPWLAYPYGLESPAVQSAAATAGYDCALGISGGWHRAADVSRFARPRLNVPAGMSVNGLRARVLGAIRA
jgi:peptidoglycan/xylan/chitin deacetylase (PgdA/CDA1 family)